MRVNEFPPWVPIGQWWENPRARQHKETHEFWCERPVDFDAIEVPKVQRDSELPDPSLGEFLNMTAQEQFPILLAHSYVAEKGKKDIPAE